MSNVKDLMRHAADLVVLSVLADGPQYGYAISKQVAARTEAHLHLTPSVLYPLLHQLEKQGLVNAEWETVKADDNKSGRGRNRKWYRLSAKGRRKLQQHARAHRAYQQLIEPFLPAIKRDGA